MPMPPDRYSMPSRDFSTLLGATRVAPVDADCAWSVALQVAARNAALIQPIWRAAFMSGLLGCQLDRLDKERAARVQRAGLAAVSAPGRAPRSRASSASCRNSRSRSEERRVGKECRSRWSRYHEK